MNKNELLNVLAKWSQKFIPEFISEHIIPHIKEALENPMLCHYLEQWEENNNLYEDNYVLCIKESLESGEKINQSVMMKIYKEKTSIANDVIYDFFSNDAYTTEPDER